MKKLLFVEDNKISGRLFKKKIELETRYEIDWALTMAEAIAMLDENEDQYLLAILDFNLPDSIHGEIVQEVTGRGLPAIVFTGMIDEEIRSFVWSKKVVDYVQKSGGKSLNEVITLIRRLERNAEIKVLLVDDSKMSRNILKSLLEVHRYGIVEAANGVDALKALEEHPEIELVIIDAVMHGMDGFELTEKIRKSHSRDKLGIIGISSQGQNLFSAKFIKAGANDFIIKQTFLPEEFYCRITQCIESIENLRKVKEAAIMDSLTGLHNRRYLLEMGTKLLANCKRTKTSLSCCMIDIDSFSAVNDSYGQDAGDIVLQKVAEKLHSAFRETDIISRFGGEEFCLLLVNINKDDSLRLLEEIRTHFESQEIEVFEGQKVTITLSIGIVTDLKDDMNELIKETNSLLHQAKQGGKNNTVIL